MHRKTLTGFSMHDILIHVVLDNFFYIFPQIEENRIWVEGSDLKLLNRRAFVFEPQLMLYTT